MVETPKQAAGGKDEAGSDSDDDIDPIVRRGLLVTFRQRRRFSIPMQHQPSDKLMAKVIKLRQKRLATAFPLKDVIATSVRTRWF